MEEGLVIIHIITGKNPPQEQGEWWVSEYSKSLYWNMLSLKESIIYIATEKDMWEKAGASKKTIA